MEKIVWQGAVAVLSARGGPKLIDLHSVYALIALQGSLPDIECETDVNINLFLCRSK